MGNYTVAVLDFETTGLSPEYGDRVIEAGAVLVENNRIVDRFQTLMHPGRRISSFIEQYTGITNTMLEGAPPVAEAMRGLLRFIGSSPLVAHNASFDRRFLDAEMGRLGRQRCHEMACSMLVARRLYPDSPGHSLGTLVDYRRLPGGTHHRALSDAEMTAQLWIAMTEDLKSIHRLPSVSFHLLQRLSRMAKKEVPAFLKREAAVVQEGQVTGLPG